eukprot:423189_1
MVSNTVKVILLIVNISMCWIITSFVIYQYHQFKKISYSVMIQKRHPQILGLQIICLIMMYSIGFPLMTLDWMFFDVFAGTTQTILSRINCIVYPMGGLGTFLTIAYRFWHIYFDLKHSSTQKNSEWKYHLDPDLVEHNFWLTHKKNYGSPSYTKKK